MAQARLQAAKDSLHSALTAHDHTQQQLYEVTRRAEERAAAHEHTKRLVAAGDERESEQVLISALRKENRELRAQLGMCGFVCVCV
jgi:hypothetical protein